MAYFPGKFARFQFSSVAIAGPYRWAPSFKRERLDTTNFESAVGPSGNNVHSEGVTGVLDTTFSVEIYLTDANVNLFFPDAGVICDLLFRKNVALGYKGIAADVLELSPSTAVREVAKATAQLQSNGVVYSAA